MPLQAGELRHRITIQREVIDSESPTGDIEEKSWIDKANVWAKKQESGGGEEHNDAELREEREVVWTIRHRTDITSDMRIKHKNKEYDIVGIVDPGGLQERLEIATELDQDSLA